MRLLVVEDDDATAALLLQALRAQGYAVTSAATGNDALWEALDADFDAVVLDVGIPAPDGFEVVRQMRAAGRWSPVLLLSGRTAVEDRVTGLDAGADDYLVKPFALSELLARLRALVRRGPRDRVRVLQVGDLRVDAVGRQVWRGSVPVALSPTEFALLEELAAAPGRPLGRAHLLEHVWAGSGTADSNLVDVYVRYLRNKVDRPFGRSSLRTVRGVGYGLYDDLAPDLP